MIGHEYPGMDEKAVFFGAFPQPSIVESHILITGENGLPVVPSLYDMDRVTGRAETRSPGH
jgi:hypothetical protein